MPLPLHVYVPKSQFTSTRSVRVFEGQTQLVFVRNFLRRVHGASTFLQNSFSRMKKLVITILAVLAQIARKEGSVCGKIGE